MKKICSLLASLLFSFLSLSQEDGVASIYSVEKVELETLWKRVADKSFRLRSVEAGEISPDEKYVASGSKFGYSVMLWNTVDGTLKWENKRESEDECITFSPDSKYVASGGKTTSLIFGKLRQENCYTAWNTKLLWMASLGLKMPS